MNVPETIRLPLTAILGVLAAAVLSLSARSEPEASKLRSPAGEVRALVVGIDNYRFGRPLRGAVADARDIASALRRDGVADVGTLLDSSADRTSMIRSIRELLSRSQSGDLVILSIAGRGAREPEHFKGTQPDGRDDVFLLSGFDPSTTDGARQRILGSEFNHFIKQFASKGAQVLFVVDAGYGGTNTRTVDPRAAEMSYRQAPSYTIEHDTLEAISTAADVSLAGAGLEKVAVLEAGERTAAAPEVLIPGESTFRGALSYAVARALEGAADQNHDGQITEDELFRYVSQLTYQLSDQRQHVSAQTSVRSSDAAMSYGRTRGVVLLDPQTKSEPRPTLSPSSAAAALAPSLPRPAALPRVAAALDMVRVAVLGNQTNLLKELQPKYASFRPVAIAENPDLIWDPAAFDVLAGGDVVAHQIRLKDLPDVIDWFAAVNGFKRLAAKSPQTVRIVPSDRVHLQGSRVEVQVSGVAKRSLLLFNMTGNGTVQLLYPTALDSPVLSTPEYKFSVVVGEPLGEDQVVAVTSAQSLDDLTQVLKAVNQKIGAVEIYRSVERYAPPDARVGATGLYTAP